MDKLIKIINSLPFLKEINSLGGEIYAVGGIVRDTLMDIESDDLDIVIRNVEFSKLMEILKKYGSTVDTSGYENEGDGLRGSIKFVSKEDNYNEYLVNNGLQKTIDVMLPRKESKDKKSKGHKGIISIVNHKFTIEDDLERRDININAIAISQYGNIIDKDGRGQSDIKNKKIRVVNSDVFLDDPLRMLRIIRQTSKYKFEIDDSTVDLIKKNAPMLADKAELPKERFLMEFKKMIGKSDLGRAVKALVDFGMYEPIFGVKPKISDYSNFDKAKSIGEFAYMMFENEPADTIVSLVNNNITNDNSILNYVKALVEYNKIASGNPRGVVIKEMPSNITIGQLANLYKLSPEAMTNSNYIEKIDRDIIDKFVSGSLPKGENEIDLKGDEFKDFVVDLITQREGGFIIKRDGVKMGRAKKMVVDAIYNEQVPNESGVIKNFLIDNSDKWML